jgi:hypothetical protein
VDETQARVFVRQILQVIRTGADLTGITLDDQICDMALKAVDNDLLWGWMWKVLGGLFDGGDALVVGADCPAVEAEAVGIDPLTIIAILKAIYELIKMFRK